MSKYIGITIGPIGETLADASTPAALWFASSIFSDITKRLCKKIKSVEGFPDAKIISPFYESEEEQNDGVGKYHDRIIFTTDQYCSEKMEEIVTKIKKETKGVFPNEVMEHLLLTDVESFLDQYLQIHYVCFPPCDIKGNAILAISPYLDMLELMKTFPIDDSKNIIRNMLNGKKNSQNSYIKNSKLFTTISQESNQIKKDKENIRTIEEIASCHSEADKQPDTNRFKRCKYYAVVQADGDSMGRFLQNSNDALDKDEFTNKFSEACLTYDAAAAKLIGEYGGMTIYAGGDDLLFLAPIVNKENKTVFSLCNEINKKFDNIIREKGFDKNIPTISFGISIQYFKSPLYEALANAGRLLFTVAKENESTKNSMAIQIQKHSGRSLCVLASNNDYDTFHEIINVSKTQEENTLTSLLYTLEHNRNLLLLLNEKASEIESHSYYAAWNNFFDNPEQKEYKDYITHICDIYYNNFIIKKVKITIPHYAQDTNATDKDSSLMVLLYLLQIQKFLLEKGDET